MEIFNGEIILGLAPAVTKRNNAQPGFTTNLYGMHLCRCVTKVRNQRSYEHGKVTNRMKVKIGDRAFHPGFNRGGAQDDRGIEKFGSAEREKSGR